MVDLHITGMWLTGMGKKLKPVELWFCALAYNCGDELMWSMVLHQKQSPVGAVVS